jgi:hypothetical protein
MNITAHRLTSATAFSAVTAGAIFIGVQIDHPPVDVAHITTNEMMIRETAKAVMAVLALVGITGMFVRNRHRFGILGLAGYLLLSLGYLAMFAIEAIVGYVLPTVALTSPDYVRDVLDAAMGRSPSGDIGHLSTLMLVMGIGYAVGGLFFGIALFRARILARWASLLLAYATISVLALSALPDSFSRPFAVPAGVALIGLGVSLWRDQRRQTVQTTAADMFEFGELVPR